MKKYHQRTFALSIAAASCVLALLLVFVQYRDTRSHLNTVTPGAFNYLIQTARGFEQFELALVRYQNRQWHPHSEEKLQKEYRRQFDILWSLFEVYELGFPDISNQNRVDEHSRSVKEFLQTNDELVSKKAQLSNEEIEPILKSIGELAAETRALGYQYFAYAGTARERSIKRLLELDRLLQLFAAMFLLTGGMMVYTLYRSRRRTENLYKQARRQEKQHKHMLEEIRSGKLESKAKTNFIAAASHDLRQPLYAIDLYLGALKPHLTSQEALNNFDGAMQSTQELNNLFEKLLHISRLDAGMVKASKSNIDINAFFQTMQREFAAKANNATLTINAEPDCFAYTDPVLLGRVVRNVLENAITHSNAAEIELTARQQGNAVKICISDNGIGIAENEQHAIFSEYHQLDTSKQKKHGLGLGLSIVARVTELLDIDMTFYSQSGHGTTFWFSIQSGQNQHASSTANNDEPLRVIHAGALISVIDDKPNIQAGSVALLESMEFETITANDASDMIAKLKETNQCPDFILADYRLLDGEFGDNAIRTVRKHFNKNIPAMMITGDTSSNLIRQFEQNDFEVLHKPVKPAVLLAKINEKISASRCHKLDDKANWGDRYVDGQPMPG